MQQTHPECTASICVRHAARSGLTAWRAMQTPEQEVHPLAWTVEMVFLCKKCRKAFQKDMATYKESVVHIHGLPYVSQSTPMHPTAHLWPCPWPLPLPSPCRCRCPLRTTPVTISMPLPPPFPYHPRHRLHAAATAISIPPWCETAVTLWSDRAQSTLRMSHDLEIQPWS